MHKKEYTAEIAGRTFIAEFSDLADQANGSVLLKCDNTVVMATAVMSADGKGNQGWFNLTVEYMEKFYAAGEILGARFTRREGKPSERAVLSSRIIDRSIRPLFDQHIKNAVQIIVSVFSVGTFDPTILALNAVSLALATSDIPWRGPLGAVALRRTHEEKEIRPNGYTQVANSTHPDTPYAFDMTLCGCRSAINMIEAGAFEAPETIVRDAMAEALQHITALEQWQTEIIADIGKAKQIIEKKELPKELTELFETQLLPELTSRAFGSESKHVIHEFEKVWADLVTQHYPDSTAEHISARELAPDYYHQQIDRLLHRAALDNNQRVDLRAMDEVRELYAQVGGISPLLHGTGIFYRGGTHVMSFLTLAGPEERLEVQDMEIKEQRRYFHHYNFPPFSAGETGRVGGFNRREIGHGVLAEKALVPVLPSVTDFPYTMRVVSESVASNGSTSQASICASSLALMDGGVPIVRPVAGIAMGLILDDQNPKNYRILTDIQGPEDHHGDMDFKVAGTSEGITALQLDVKVDGVSVEILSEALDQARTARLHILKTITKEISAPRADINEHAPRIVHTKIDESKIGMVIGSGGKTIKQLQERTQTVITIEDTGVIYITGKGTGPHAAKTEIENMTHEWTIGETTEGEVVKIIEAGAIVKLSEHADGFVHISEIAAFRLTTVSEALQEHMRVPVQVISIDKEKNRIGLSIEKAHPGFIQKK